MNSKYVLLCISLLFIGVQIQAQKVKVKLKSPRATFHTLVKSIEAKNLKTYQKCWFKETLESEGQLSALEKDPESWKELQGIFRQPLTIEMERYFTQEALEMYSCQIKAPNADEGGIGKLTMIKEGKYWKMYRW